MTAVVSTPGVIRLASSVAITCEASSLDLLLHKCLKRIVYEMATRGEVFALAPGHPSLPQVLRPCGQQGLIGGSMATQSLILAGTNTSGKRVFSSACTGAGHEMSRQQALKTRMGRQVVDELTALGIVVAVPLRGVAAEAPSAHKDVRAVADAAEAIGLASKVARRSPVICIKG
jgi:tRNA-splicing ligase RtcB